jgi:hypothetical protein
MPGLHMTDEERRAQITALIDEMGQYERRAKGASDDDDRAKWEDRVEQVREQLRLRGHDGAAPHQRASKRTRSTEGVETR